MAESIVLDPSELTSSRASLDITDWITQDGADWGDASVEPYMADTSRGALPVDFRVPNRSISIPLRFSGTVGGTTTAQARAAIQAKAALIQREGGWIRRVTAAGGTVYADLTNASFNATSVTGWESRQGADISASLDLEAIPDFYEDETTDADNSTTTARELVFNTTMTAQGDVPNRIRLVVDNDGTTDWRGLIWSFRSRHFPGATATTTAATAYEAEGLGALDTARIVSGTSVYGTATNGQWSGGTIVHHGTISTNWTPVLGGRIGGTTFPTHTGTNRMFARVASTSGTLTQCRAVWDVGDLVLPVENDSLRLPGANNAYIVDLGEVRLDQAPVGTHRWDWQIQAKGDVGTETFSVDRVWILNADEGFGEDTAPFTLSRGLATYSARSEFNTESGAITGDSLAVGGTWVGAGDADDFSVAGGVATRAAVSDADVNTGRYITASTPSLTNTVVQVDAKVSAGALGGHFGVIARYTDTSNWLMATMDDETSAGVSDRLIIRKRVAGTVSTVAELLMDAAFNASDRYWTVSLYVDTAGRVAMWWYPAGSTPGAPAVTGYDSTLATGGTLASGKVGIYDAHTAAGAVTRTYDNFSAWAPAPDAVAFASRSAQLTTQGIYRQDSGGTAYGPVSSVAGDLPRFPVPSVSGGTVEVTLVPSTGDFNQLPDAMGTASISARATRRRGWLFVS